MKQDILHRLQIDPGQRTIGELIQDRAAAAHEIIELRRQIERLRTVRNDRKERTVETAPKTQTFRPGTLLRISTVCELVGTSRSTIYRWVSEGTFPQPVRISEKAIRWNIDEFETWRAAL